MLVAELEAVSDSENEHAAYWADVAADMVEPLDRAIGLAGYIGTSTGHIPTFEDIVSIYDRLIHQAAQGDVADDDDDDEVDDDAVAETEDLVEASKESGR